MRNSTPTFPYPRKLSDVPTPALEDRFCITSRVVYRCPDACWAAHIAEWKKSLRAGVVLALEPMPYGHIMFDEPGSWGFKQLN